MPGVLHLTRTSARLAGPRIKSLNCAPVLASGTDCRRRGTRGSGTPSRPSSQRLWRGVEVGR